MWWRTEFGATMSESSIVHFEVEGAPSTVVARFEDGGGGGGAILGSIAGWKADPRFQEEKVAIDG